MDLDALKYPQLRSLAKELGLKSNIKADKLRKVIKQHYDDQELQLRGGGEEEEQQEEVQVNGNDGDLMDAQEGSGGVGASEEKEEEEQQSGPGRSLFVTSRRGRKRSTKRKIADVEPAAAAAAAADRRAVEQPLATAEEVPEESETPAPVPAERAGAKRRQISATTEPRPTGTAPGTKQQGDEPKVERAGRIPRHQGLLKKSKTLMAPITPNFKKLHEAHFKKMESIDSYVQRKTKQMEALKTSVQDLKALSERTLPKPAEGKQPPLVKRSRASPRSPAAVPKPQRAGKASQRETAGFRPSVLSTRRINVRFSEATLDNGPKKSLLKTPVRMSTPGRPASDKRSVTNVSTAKSPEAFVFTGNTSFSTTPGTNKTSFDLKASLSKPLSYKPHKGKLKPFGETKENNNNNNSVVQSSHQKNYKQHQVQTREDRRFKQTQDRKQKKEGALGARRGLVMS